MNPQPPPMERFCIHTRTTRQLSMKEILDMFPVFGVKGVSVWRSRFEEFPPSRLGRRIHDAGMEPVSVVRGGFFPAPNTAARREAIEDNRKAIGEAAELGAPMLVLVCGALPGALPRESIDQVRAGIEAVLPDAEKAGVILAIEPLHPMYAADRSAVVTMKTANELAEEFNSPQIGVAVDVFHTWWDPGLETEIIRCGRAGNLVAFHVCDWKPEMEDMLEDRGLMGEGVIRVREIRRWMETAGFKGFIEVEIFSRKWWAVGGDDWLKAIKEAYVRST